MAKSRIKKKVYTSVTREEAEQAFAELAKADAANEKMIATMDTEMTKIREKYQDDIAVNVGIIDESAYITLNPTVLGDKRSIQLTHGKIGYRLGQPAIKVLKGFTWEACKNLAKQLISANYIREKEELDKEKLLSDRDVVLTKLFDYEGSDPIFSIDESERPTLSSLFKECGFEVEQKETFYIETKKESILVEQN
jgi:phage host-nuclease inhibitor protein Gam